MARHPYPCRRCEPTRVYHLFIEAVGAAATGVILTLVGLRVAGLI